MYRQRLRWLAGGVVLVVVLTVGGVAESEPVGSGSSPTGAAEASPTEGATNYGWGIEIRQGGLGQCSSATPAPCYAFVYDVGCPVDGFFRLSRVRTFMWAVGSRFVGFRLRARLIEHGQPASTGTWSTADVATFAGRPQGRILLMGTTNISGPSDLSKQWDIQVQYRYKRSGGLPDIVVTRRHLETFEC